MIGRSVAYPHGLLPLVTIEVGELDLIKGGTAPLSTVLPVWGLPVSRLTSSSSVSPRMPNIICSGASGLALAIRACIKSMKAVASAVNPSLIRA